MVPARLSLSDALAECRRLATRSARHIIGITGPPGSGKSRLAAAILEELGSRVALVPMDGFHLADEVLRLLGSRDRKGAPDTFDVAGYVALLSRIRAGEDPVVYAPRFDRGLEAAIAGALPVPADTPLIVAEGNYLLHDSGGWERVRPLLDAVWYLDVPGAELRRRLVSRRVSHGEPPAEAAAWVDRVDLANAATVAAARKNADRILRW